MRSPQLLSKGPATFNMTPMIDVVFLLIIFFLVSSHLAKRENSIQLDLPTAGSGLDEQVAQQSFVVNVLENGSWMIGGVEASEQSIALSLRKRAMESQGAVRLKIRTDESVPYDRLEPILKAASEVGIGDIVFSVFEETRR